MAVSLLGFLNYFCYLALRQIMIFTKRTQPLPVIHLFSPRHEGSILTN